jgi:hypothetical protein
MWNPEMRNNSYRISTEKSQKKSSLGKAKYRPKDFIKTNEGGSVNRIQ